MADPLRNKDPFTKTYKERQKHAEDVHGTEGLETLERAKTDDLLSHESESVRKGAGVTDFLREMERRQGAGLSSGMPDPAPIVESKFEKAMKERNSRPAPAPKKRDPKSTPRPAPEKPAAPPKKPHVWA